MRASSTFAVGIRSASWYRSSFSGSASPAAVGMAVMANCFTMPTFSPVSALCAAHT